MMLAREDPVTTPTSAPSILPPLLIADCVRRRDSDTIPWDVFDPLALKLAHRDQLYLDHCENIMAKSSTHSSLLSPPHTFLRAGLSPTSTQTRDFYLTWMLFSDISSTMIYVCEPCQPTSPIIIHLEGECHRVSTHSATDP